MVKINRPIIIEVPPSKQYSDDVQINRPIIIELSPSKQYNDVQKDLVSRPSFVLIKNISCFCFIFCLFVYFLQMRTT